MALRAHLRSKFQKQSPQAEALISREVFAASSGSDDVNSSGDEQSSSDYTMEGGSPVAGRKKYETVGGSGDPTAHRGKVRGPNRAPSPESSSQRSGSVTSNTVQWEDKEKNIYETQLKTLQEQLVDTMIQNQALNSEIALYKCNGDVTRLNHLYADEKKRCSKLTQECEELHQQLDNMERRSYSVEHQASIDLSEADSADISAALDLQPPVKSTVKSRAQEWLVNKVYEVIADFSEEAEEEKVDENDEGDELTVKQLKANIKRFKAGYKPIVQWFKAIGNLFSWKSAPASIMALLIYMYAIGNGWLISLMLGLTLWHLTKTYLISKGFAIKFSLLPYSEEEENGDVDKHVGLSDKFQLVLLVARKVQNYMGMLADSLEKLQNLVMWGSPEATQKLYTGLLCAFIASIILPSSWFFIGAGISLGFKLFITDNFFRKFPHMKTKYDGATIMWRLLPTHEQRLRRSTLERRKKYVIPAASTTLPPAEGQSIFSEMFSIPPEETPLPGWQAGKRCTQIVRDKAVALRHGRLYLTRSFLCFERGRSRNHFGKNIVIPLADIVTVEKAKPFSFFPGPGMSIEIRVVSEEKPYIFAAILNRDEVFAVLLRHVCSVRNITMKDSKAKELGEPSSSASSEKRSKDPRQPGTSSDQ